MKERLLQVLKKGITVKRTDEGDTCEVWVFDDLIMTEEMKKLLSLE